ncbi:AI-2E family transporter, partial [Aliterella atlantica]|uniref:AI-2E family transporter n=1 Tax=Aliterella atlantica TaxID=1827278 RepID=UPI0005D376C1
MKLGKWIGLLATIISLYILWQIREILLLLFTAVVLATAINQLVQQFQKLHIKRPWAIFISVSASFALFIVFLLLIVPPFVEQFQELVKLFPNGLTRIQDWLNTLEDRILGWYPDLPDINVLVQQIVQQVQPLANQLFRNNFNFLFLPISAILQLLLVLVLTLMLLVNPQPYRQGFIKLFPSFYRKRVDEILLLCESGLKNWTVGALIEMVFIAALSGIGLWILQVPLILAHAILAGVLNFIPNIGPTLSVVLPMAIALLDAPWKAGAVLILYLAIQNIESYWLTPTVMAHQVALLPAITLTAQIFFTSFFGFLGLLLAL